jgi:hypothetical protein
MSSPVIIQGFSAAMLGPLVLALLTAWFFWSNVVPRQLKGLQVAFQTGAKTYEVHRITSTVDDVKGLLAQRGTRFGVVSYLMALSGSLILLFEFFNYRGGNATGYHAPSVAFALILIILPALISSGTSLGAQVIRPMGVSRATLQNSTRTRNVAYVALTLAWLVLAFAVNAVLQAQGVSQTNRYSFVALVAFSPAVLAYGRILGSAWYALKQSSKQIARGGSSPFHNHLPNARQQFIAQVVHLNLVAMPFVALNTFVSLVVLLWDPSMFTHSDRVLNLPEYRPQSTYMEEGGLLGFALIELFSNIPQAGIRVPIVTTLLLFLLLNVAAIGFLFVYEVARILFLDVQDISGVGGIRLADSRLLRAEPVQQATVLNFCFTGFAGQSMLLLALAMITFWDSSFLPQGAACGPWEGSVCAVMEKDTLEQLTWMLASGGQVAFLAIWAMSWRRAGQLDEITFDASMDEDRTRLRGMSDMIYLKQRPVHELIAGDEWTTALQRYEAMSHGREATLVGLDMVRQTKANMMLHAAMGQWDDAEELAVNLLALQGGRDAQISRLILCAASLAQRDYREATPRLNLLTNDDVEAVRLKWVASVLYPKYNLDPEARSMLSVDPLTKDNARMLERYASFDIRLGDRSPRTAAQRAMFLSDVARMRMLGRSEEALNQLERHLNRPDAEGWVHGHLVKALLNHDDGRSLTALSALEALAKEHPRDPHVKSLMTQFARKGEVPLPPSEPTKFEWSCDQETDWRTRWHRHNVKVPPVLDHDDLKAHALKNNAWTALLTPDARKALSSKNGHRTMRAELPLGLYTHLSGIVVTVGGMPVDLGLPASYDHERAQRAGLLSL